MKTKPFKNLVVVELAGVLAGPAVGLFFAELGAKVYKIENPITGGDITRQWKTLTEPTPQGVSGYYYSVNQDKTVCWIDLKKPKDKGKLLKLIRKADIVITNYKKGDDKKLGVDYSTLKKINPGLIYAKITGYGEDDPKPAFDLLLQAETGFMSINGTPQSGPLKMPIALIDILAAHQLKEGILTALINKTKSGKGQKVSVSLYDSAIASLANQATNWLIGKKIPKLSGSLHPNIAPYGEQFKTKDNHLVVLAIGTDKQFNLLLELINNNNLKNNVLYKNNNSRILNRKALQRALGKYIITQNCDSFLVACNTLGIPAAQLKSIDQALKEPKAKPLIKRNSLGYKSVKTAVFTFN